ncbi:MAG: hypothetical protein FWE48_07075 [Coriobacteriia bacterium]|nr:hypothetical protein [Coriobacteriia bacterium]
MKKKTILGILLAVTVVFFATGYFVLQSAWDQELQDIKVRNTEGEPDSEAPTGGIIIPPNQDFVSTSSYHLPLDFTYADPYMGNGSIYVSIYPEPIDGRIFLESPQDPITLALGNTGSVSRNILLKALYNYEEVAFRVQGSDTYDAQLLLSLDAGTAVDVPIQLSSSIAEGDINSRLTLVTITSPEHFVASGEEISEWERWSPGMLGNYIIDYGYEEISDIDSPPHEIAGEIVEFPAGFSINTDLEPSEDAGHFRFGNLPYPLIVTSGEEVSLSFFVNAPHELGLSDIDSYLIISMLGWQQINMNDKPYLWVDLSDPLLDVENGQYGHFSIIAPSESGFYEFFALLLPNPKGESTPHATGVLRFTLEVTD